MKYNHIFSKYNHIFSKWICMVMSVLKLVHVCANLFSKHACKETRNRINRIAQKWIWVCGLQSLTALCKKKQTKLGVFSSCCSSNASLLLSRCGSNVKKIIYEEKCTQNKYSAVNKDRQLKRNVQQKKIAKYIAFVHSIKKSKPITNIGTSGPYSPIYWQMHNTK